MKSVKVIVEGGGHKSLDSECREAFSKLFGKLGIKNVQFVAGRSRDTAFKKFRNEVINFVPYTKKTNGSWPVLLVDSEEIVVTATKIEHLVRRSNSWKYLETVEERQVQLMATCTESWFLYDRDILRDYFGTFLRESSLPPSQNIEEIDHNDVLDALEEATKKCGENKIYTRKTKAAHEFKILSRLDPNKLIGQKYFDATVTAIKVHPLAGHTKT